MRRGGENGRARASRTALAAWRSEEEEVEMLEGDAGPQEAFGVIEGLELVVGGGDVLLAVALLDAAEA